MHGVTMKFIELVLGYFATQSRCKPSTSWTRIRSSIASASYYVTQFKKSDLPPSLLHLSLFLRWLLHRHIAITLLQILMGGKVRVSFTYKFDNWVLQFANY